MTKYEITALMMRKESRFEGDAFAVAAKLATCVETLADRLDQDELKQLISIGSAIYCMGADECKQEVSLEDLFPACENRPAPNSARGGFHHGG